MFMLWVLLLLAAAPASAVMDVQPRNHAWELPASSYDLAPDVRDGPNLYAYVKQNPWTKFDPLGLWLMGYEGGDMDKNTARILNNVRQADPRLNRIVQELEDSPYPFQISAHFTANDSKTYGGEKGEFSPAELNPIKVEGRQRTRDCTGRKTLDRYNGKGMGGRIWSIGEVVDGKTPEETMAHELGHAFDCNRGISPLDAKKGKLTEKTILPSRLVDVDENENRAVRTENIYNEAKGNKLRTSYPVTPDNDRKQEAVPNPEGKNAPVNFEPAEKAPRRSPTSSARP
jgi:hypothetical protein